ncbi:MAG: NAD-glutamate dehydrogenase [Burkholderiales bacterium]|nr:NAD-glutamate dehydrogenase [Burkholderiales bacterium]
MPTHTLTELIQHTQEHGGSDAARLVPFVPSYFANTDPGEIENRGAATLFAIANAHWRLLESVRPPKFEKIRVFNPSLAEDGFVSDHTAIQIVHPDMPFLVDSVTMAVNRSGRTAHWIVHPLMAVLRDDQGRVSEASPAAGARKVGAEVVSMIFVECDRIVSEADMAALAADLASVLNDVRCAVKDWRPMLERVRELAQESAKTSIASVHQQEGIAFLNWLEDKHFTFLGARNYELARHGNTVTLAAVPDSGLGILRGEVQTPLSRLPEGAISLLDSDQLVLVTKAMTRATVHRPAWLDCIAVKRFDDAGQVVGEARFLGLYTSTAYQAPVHEIPQVRVRAQQVLQDAGVVPDSHTAKSLQAIFETYPRDELFQIDQATLSEHALAILRLQERQRTRVLLRRDPFGRFTSVQVFVPRDRYNTELRLKVGQELMDTLDGQGLEFTPMLTDSPLARIHYLVRAKELAPNNVDLRALEARVAKLAQRWEDECTQQLLRALGEGEGLAMAHRFASAFSAAYREDFSPAVGAEDAQVLARLTPNQPLAVKLYRPLNAGEGMLRFKIYNTTKVALSDSLPVLEHMGARVLDEHPYRIGRGADTPVLWLHDIGLQMAPDTDFSAIRLRFEALFAQTWKGEVESDDLNRLLLSTTLGAREITVLRAYTRYFKQLGLPFGQGYIEAALNHNAPIAEEICALFAARFDPSFQGDRDQERANRRARIESLLGDVQSLDDDRILRQFYASVVATLRTNAWQTTSDGRFKPYLSFKFDPRQLPGVPEPKPLFEIWVCSPRVEGVHMRGGKVARGGLRWSDRREDFRTEILGLVKAQQVKNTVIVPVGSKGGFVVKNPPPASDREAYLAEGVACYRTFLSGMLDVTDNLVQGQVVPPQQVVRHDEDDPYLVVAADKGTATFSDIANQLSADYGFWLGDAFASGGSVGYDHKKMGITARGAWESVKRHFRSLGVNTQTTRFTVAGVGDMSGDVFGNGMLLSEHIALVAAFDHRHIFIDPTPDVAVSHAERKRLFQLPRSSWADYNPELISAGGGVFPRSAKSIRLSEQARAALGTEAAELTPAELLRVVLLAPVDLLYNGGIGTYVKASFETHAQVGDKASDGFRVNGNELRCKVLAEGGNLGATQNGRIEFAAKGGRIYTDAIDNSAGVDCSDHEVNIKILLDRVVEAGDLTLKQRNDLLASMTDEVAHLVLADNYYQTQSIDVARHRPLYVLDGQQRLMQSLEAAGRLNRAIEFLPTDDEILRRRVHQQGLTAPEGAVVLAYAKMWLFDELMASNLPDDPHFNRTLKTYFPHVLCEKFGEAIAAHPLKREIIATFVTNTVLNRAGATFVHYVANEANANAADVVRAYTLAREIFDLEAQWDRIDGLDHRVGSTLQLDLLSRLTTITQRASRWILRVCANGSDLPTLIERYQPGARELRTHLGEWLSPEASEQWKTEVQALMDAGVEPDLAHNLAALDHLFPALELVDVSQDTGGTLEQAARAYFAVDAHLGLTHWRAEVVRLPTDTLWQTQARSSARDDVYAIASQITRSLLSQGNDLHSWTERHAGPIARLHRLRQTISTQTPDLAPVSVALRELRNLV